VMRLGILALSCTLAVAAAPAQLPELEVIQLREVDGKIPVEIVNAKIEESSPHPTFSFSVRNNTTRPMNAVVVKMGIIYYGTATGGGARSTLTTFVDRALHPDIQDAWGRTPIAPGGEQTFPSDLFRHGSGITSVTSITLSVDYADFADGTSVGPNQYGTIWITGARRGAAKYKQWLKDNHKDKSKAEVESLLMSASPPAEIGFEGGGEEFGAQIYMSNMERAFKMKGIDVTKYLR
jgi:hypothetical protein